MRIPRTRNVYTCTYARCIDMRGESDAKPSSSASSLCLLLLNRWFGIPRQDANETVDKLEVADGDP